MNNSWYDLYRCLASVDAYSTPEWSIKKYAGDYIKALHKLFYLDWGVENVI